MAVKGSKLSMVAWLACAVAAVALVIGAREGAGMLQAVARITQTAQEQRAAAPRQAPHEPEPLARGPLRFGVPEPLPRPAGTVRLATYNIANLFDDVDDPTLSGRNEDIDDYKSPAERAAAADAIRRINPDILALQEIESLAALLEFRDEYLADLGYEHVVSVDSGDPRGIENAVLSRFPLSDPQVWPDLPLGGFHPERFGRDRNEFAGQPITFKRSPLRVTVSIPAESIAMVTGEAASSANPYTLTLFVVHHKSGAPAGYWRDREAAKTVDLAREWADSKGGEKANVIICGDFNSRPNDPPVKTYLAAGFTDAFADRIDRDPRFVTHESGRVIDFILLNPAVRREFVPSSKFVLGVPARPEGADWRTTPPPPGWASDHYPVVIDLAPVDN